MIIAIDGPAGSGKSTVARKIAERLGLLYVDTGAMYRAMTLKAVRQGLDLKDGAALAKAAKGTAIELTYDDKRNLAVYLDKIDVSKEIRTPDLTNKVKFIAGVAGVREEMVKKQRSLAKTGKGAVLEGRDIGTVVFPDADRKFYLDANFKERARRRYKELAGAGEEVSLAAVEEDVRARDSSDMERAVAPLKKAKDAVTIDTTYMSIEETIEKVLSYVK